MGTSWISRKGEILEKEWVDLEKGDMTPLTNYDYEIWDNGNSIGGIIYLVMIPTWLLNMLY